MVYNGILLRNQYSTRWCGGIGMSCPWVQDITSKRRRPSSGAALSFWRDWGSIHNCQALVRSPVPLDPIQIPKPKQSKIQKTNSDWSFTLKSHSVSEWPLPYPSRGTDRPGEHQDQGHGVVLHDQGEGHQPAITSRSGSSQVPQGVNDEFNDQI